MYLLAVAFKASGPAVLEDLGLVPPSILLLIIINVVVVVVVIIVVVLIITFQSCY